MPSRLIFVVFIMIVLCFVVGLCTALRVDPLVTLALFVLFSAIGAFGFIQP